MPGQQKITCLEAENPIQVGSCFFRSNSLRLFSTTKTVLPSCPTTPTVSGIAPKKAKLIKSTTVPREIVIFWKMTLRARLLNA
jgi:hypothetical protein